MRITPFRVLGGIAALGAGTGAVQTLLDGGDAASPSVDEHTARRAAERTLAQVDWTRDAIVVWAGGTLVEDMGAGLRRGLEEAPGSDRTSVVRLEYPATGADMAGSAALGARTLELVLDEVRRRDPDGSRYHLALQGESQGAWVVNDVIGDFGGLDATQVDRVAVYGLPALATHDDTLDDEPRARVVNHTWDPVTWRALGSTNDAMDAAGRIFQGEGDLSGTAAYLLLNPLHSLVFLGATAHMEATGDRTRHPHIYERELNDAGSFLLDGIRPA